MAVCIRAENGDQLRYLQGHSSTNRIIDVVVEQAEVLKRGEKDECGGIKPY